MWSTFESACYVIVIVSATLMGLFALWVTFRPPGRHGQYAWLLVFLALSCVGIAAAVVDHRANDREQATRFRELNDKLDQSAELREGFLTLDKIDILQSMSTLGIGRQFGGNFHAVNKGSTRIYNAVGLTQAYVVDVDENTERMVRQSFANALKPLEEAYRAGKSGIQNELAPGASVFGTSTTRPLTKHDLEGLAVDAIRIYFVSYGIWKSARGKIGSTYDCRWLQSSTLATQYRQVDIVWHYCGQ